MLGSPKIEPTTKEEVEEEVYADPSTSSVGLPPLHTHHHPTQFESLATDPVFDEAEVDFGGKELDVDFDFFFHEYGRRVGMVPRPSLKERKNNQMVEKRTKTTQQQTKQTKPEPTGRVSTIL